MNFSQAIMPGRRRRRRRYTLLVLPLVSEYSLHLMVLVSRFYEHNDVDDVVSQALSFIFLLPITSSY